MVLSFPIILNFLCQRAIFFLSHFHLFFLVFLNRHISIPESDQSNFNNYFMSVPIVAFMTGLHLPLICWHQELETRTSPEEQTDTPGLLSSGARINI